MKSVGLIHIRVRCWYCLPLVFSLAAMGGGCGALETAQMTDVEKLNRIEDLYQESLERTGRVPTMHAGEYFMWPEEQRPVLVDVRPPEERAVSMIPGAISKEEFETNQLNYIGHRILTYCTVGARSAEYTRELRRNDWDAYNMPGSILAWTHTQQPLVTPDGEETRRVHVYSRRWNYVADGYEPVW